MAAAHASCIDYCNLNRLKLKDCFKINQFKNAIFKLKKNLNFRNYPDLSVRRRLVSLGLQKSWSSTRGESEYERRERERERERESVVYFYQQTGAPHAVCWLKSFVFELKQVFSYFSVTNGKKRAFVVTSTQNHQMIYRHFMSKRLFQPANGMRSTSLLVETHNKRER